METQLTIIDCHVEIKRQIQDTSRQAFYEIKASGLQNEQYEKIKKYLSAIGNLTNNEIADYTRYKISSVTARVNELRKLREVVFVGRKLDKHTGKTCMVWGLA